MSTVYREVQNAAVPINNNNPVVVQLRVPDKEEGIFTIFGRLVFTNQDGAAQRFTATLTTLNGQTVLDEVSLTVDAGKTACVSLQTILDLNEDDQNDIVDIHCASLHGQAEYGALTARYRQS
jgi:hypothetical protein